MEMESFKDISQRIGMGSTSDMMARFESMTPREREEYKAASYNRSAGLLKDGFYVGDNYHEGDGYHCEACNDKGHYLKVIEFAPGDYRQVSCDCKCIPIRNSINRMKRSGLKNIITDYAFDGYEVTEPWQATLKQRAMEYAANPDGWFFLGGQSGCGKTHLCTAICREHLLAGKEVRYMMWRDDAVQLKAAVNDDEEYRKLIEPYKRAEILYIDDLFKTGEERDYKTGAKKKMRPTVGDINVAFEILNHRYVNRMTTIITSELSVDDILYVDEAVGGRIVERAKGAISIAKDKNKNYRTRGAITL